MSEDKNVSVTITLKMTEDQFSGGAVRENVDYLQQAFEQMQYDVTTSVLIDKNGKV